MKTTNLIPFFIFLLYFTVAKSQIFHNESCACSENLFDFADNSKYTVSELTNFMDSLQKANGNEEKILYRIPIRLHLYAGKNNSGGLTQTQIKELMLNINYYNALNKTGIRFYMHPDVDYVHSSRHKRLGYFVEGPIQTFKKRTKGSIDVLVALNLTKIYLGIKGESFFGTYNPVTKGIIIRQTSSTQTMSHEVGHYLGLRHPHHDSHKGKKKQESVSRTREVKGIFRSGLNCEKNGDRLSDTPAEPNLTKYTDDKCNYTGQKRDKWGDLYKPDVKNIMSYTSNRECRVNFTTQQKAMMLKTADADKYSEGWSTASSFARNYEFDAFEPNENQETASEILFNTPQDHTFHKVFAGFKADDIDKDTDWIVFEQKDKSTKDVTITITNNSYQFAKIKVSVYDKFGKIKESTQVSTEFVLVLKGLSRGKYYINVEQLTKQDKITGYRIQVK